MKSGGWKTVNVDRSDEDIMLKRSRNAIHYPKFVGR